MSRRRRICLLLSAVMALGTLSACGSEAEELPTPALSGTLQRVCD